MGKTRLAIALDVQAVQHGFLVSLQRLDELLSALERDNESPWSRLQRKRYLNVASLVIDEMEFELMNRHEASRFFRLFGYRYGRGSTLITTQGRPTS